jgi:hypothetical protein
MSSLLDLTDSHTDRPTIDAAQRLRTTMAAVRIAFVWFGVRKTLTPEQKSQAADTFGAAGEYVSAAKKLLDTSHPSFKLVTSTRGRILNFWRGLSLPYPEPGIRLIRQDDIAAFNVQMTTLQAELAAAVAELDQRYDELKQAARRRLGSLYNASDYPTSLTDLFSVTWDYPAFEPPQYLRHVSPELYEQESRRITARFEEAVQLAEQAFTEEFSKVVAHLTERLSGQEDGKPKVFRDSAVENLREFFDRFRHLNVRSSEELDRLVEQSQQIIRGIEPQQLRDNPPLRQQLATQLSSVQSVLDGMLVDRPRRNILRRAK